MGLPTSLLAALGTAAIALPATAGERNALHIVGSSTVFPYTKLVAERFAEAGEHPAPVVESTGTGGGMRSFCAGVGPDTPDFTGASRAMTWEEWNLCRENGVFDITEMTIGYDGLTLAVAKSSPHHFALTLKDIYTALAAEVPVDGKIVTNPHRLWSDVRPELPAIPIDVIGPPPTSGTRDSFVELAMHAGCLWYADLQALQDTDPERWEAVCSTMRTDGGYTEAGEDDEEIVAAIEAAPDTVGVFGYAYLLEHEGTIRGIPVEGVIPDLVTIALREYPLARPLFLYIKNEHRDLVPGMTDFLREYIVAAEPPEYLFPAGMVPILDDTTREQIAGEALDGVPMRPPGS